LLPQACAHWGKFLAAASRRSLGRVSVPVWLSVLTDQLPVIGSVGRYPADYLMGRRPLLPHVTVFLASNEASVCGLSTAFALLSPTRGQVPTWSSAVRHSECKHSAFDLHALGTPPAFVLSQDQTLHVVWSTVACATVRPAPGSEWTRRNKRRHDSVVKVRRGRKREQAK
jgi:hypothetical protein